MQLTIIFYFMPENEIAGWFQLFHSQQDIFWFVVIVVALGLEMTIPLIISCIATLNFTQKLFKTKKISYFDFFM